jgi:hypothetical protein
MPVSEDLIGYFMGDVPEDVDLDVVYHGDLPEEVEDWYFYWGSYGHVVFVLVTGHIDETDEFDHSLKVVPVKTVMREWKVREGEDGFIEIPDKHVLADVGPITDPRDPSDVEM